MKKLFIGMVAAICCVAFIAPALAEIKVEGMIQTDAYYWQQSKERVAGGIPKGNATAAQLAQDDWSTTRINMGQPHNRIIVRYTGEDKVVNGYIQIRTGGSRGNGLIQSGANGGGGIGESNLSWEYAWIDWHINPNLYFRFGRQDQIFANAYAPNQGMGWNDGHIIGLGGFGNMTGASRDGIRAFIKFNDNVRMEVGLYDANTETGTTWAGAQVTELTIPQDAALGGAASREGNVLPRFDISLPIKVANFTIEPGFTYLKQEYDQVFAGSDDSFNIWGLTLGMSAAFGPFSISGEITYGENLGSGNYVGSTAVGAARTYIPTTNNPTGNIRKIEDGKSLMAWLMLGFDFGPFAIQGVIGMGDFSNDGDPAIARDVSEGEVTQWMYGLMFPIKVTKTFTITPNIFYYDYDSDALVGGAVGTAGRTWNTDLGSELMIGATFNLVF